MNFHKRAHRRGFMFIDAIVALGLIAVIAFTLLAAKSGVARSNNAMVDRRAAVRSAERYLIEQNAGRHSDTDRNIHLADLDTPAPSGFKWVWIDATVNGCHSGLAGLVRRNP